MHKAEVAIRKKLLKVQREATLKNLEICRQILSLTEKTSGDERNSLLALFGEVTANNTQDFARMESYLLREPVLKVARPSH
jgi:hypothetical protein